MLELHVRRPHVRRRGGTSPKIAKVKVGLLGADYRSRTAATASPRIYDGENWNPKLQAPLTQPGVDVKEGDYLLAVNGRELHGD